MARVLLSTFSQNGRMFVYLHEQSGDLKKEKKVSYKKVNSIDRILPLLFLSSDFIVIIHVENLLNTFTFIGLRAEGKQTTVSWF